MTFTLPTSRLKPEGSIMAGIATAGLVVAIYSLEAGTTAQAHATDSNDPNLMTARRKAAFASVAVVAAVSLLAKDPTIFILGGGVLVVYDWHLRHATAADPITGRLTNLGGYEPAGSVVPMLAHGEAVNNY